MYSIKNLNHKINIILKKLLVSKPLRNFLFLGMSQGVNLIVPILIIPYLISTVGVEKFGILALIQTISTFFAILTDYGFNITAVRELALNRHDSIKVEKIVNHVLSSKIILTIFSLPLFIIICYFFLQNSASFLLILMSFSLVVGRALFPAWLFQGLEKNQYLGYCNLLSKLVFLLFLILFVRKEQDFIWSNFFLGMSNIIFGIGISVLYLRKINIRILHQGINLKSVLKQLHDGKDIFFSNFAINTYINSNTIILSLFSSTYNVGLYSILEKVIALMRVPLEIFLQSIYPYACQLVRHNEYKVVSLFLRKIDFILITGMILLCITVYIFAPNIVYYLANSHDEYLLRLIRVMQIVPLIVALNVTAYITLLSYNLKKKYSQILIAGAFLSLALSFMIVPKYQIIGTITVVIITELFITISLRIAVNFFKNKNKIDGINLQS